MSSGCAPGTGEFGFFTSNCSTAEVDFPVRPADLESRSFLKSMRLVFGVPIRSEQVRGISTESLAQLCLPLGCCCWSTKPLGVDLPELLGLFPCDRIPSLPLCSFSLFRNSSLNLGFGAGDPLEILLLPIRPSPVGVEVSKDASLLSMIFRGLIGEIGSVIESFVAVVVEEVFRVFAGDRKKVENPDAGVLGVFVSLFGVEYRSSIFAGCCLGVVGGTTAGGLFFSCNVQ